MANTVFTYDPKRLAVIVGGYIISGWAENDALKVERDEDGFRKEVGVSGEVARLKSFNRAGKITLSLMQTSPSNEDLTILASLDEAAGFGAVPILARDPSGKDVFATIGWVKKFPEATYGRETAAREWVLDTSTLLIFIGGN